MSWWKLFLPGKFFYGDHLTSSARQLLLRTAVAVLGVIVAALGVGLLNAANWADVTAGALFAWATSFIGWATSSYRSKIDETAVDLRHMAELDLLHARLNHFARERNLPLLDLQGEIESVLEAREERIAHFAGLDEFRATGFLPGAEWWDGTALGVNGEDDASESE